MTIKPPEGLTEEDFERIESAVLETARGRWFLAEFARRIRAQDTQQILDAVARLERASLPVQMEHAQVHARAIGERLMDIGWRLRECGFDDSMCRALEREASAVLALAGEERGADFARAVEPAPVVVAAPAAQPAMPSSLHSGLQPVSQPALANPSSLEALDLLPTREKLAAFS